MSSPGASREPADWDRALIDEQLAEYRRAARRPDPMGRAALFSANDSPRGRLGTLALECSRCRRETPVRLRDLIRLTWPIAIHLPRRFHSLMRCPACGRRTWLRAHWRI